MDARDNTATTYTAADKSVPIYWLNGNKVADDYEDFYDGSWNEEANDKNESGTNGPNTAQTGNHPATGSDHDGTEAFNTSNVSRALGATIVRVGRPNNSTTGYGPLSSTNSAESTANRPFYGLSEVFTVADTTPPALESAGVPAAGGRINLTFDENLERVNEFDNPDEAAFTVKADGVEVVVTNTNTNPTEFRDVIISLSGSIKQGQTVTVSYDKDDAGTQPIRDAAGNETLSFTDQPVTNNSTVSPSTVPGPPTNVQAAPGGSSGSVALSWQPPDSDGGAEIDRYQYRYKTTGDYGAWSTFPGGGAARSRTVTGLAIGTLHTFQMRAHNSAGNSPETAGITATPRDKPGAPPSLVATGGAGEVTLDWGAAAPNGDAVTRYQSRYKTTGNYSAWSTVSGGGAARTVTVSSLTNGTLHTFQVRARNGAGNGTASTATATPTGTTTAPGAPPSLVATGGNGEVTLNWGAAAPNGAAVSSHQYRYKTTGNYGNWSTVIGGGAARTVTVLSLTNGTFHTFQVRARNSAGPGPASEATATPTATTTTPGAPRSLDASGGNGRVTLSWTAPASDGGAAISRYEYRYKTTGNYPATWTTVNGGGSARSVTVSSLANDTLHTFQVRARNSVGPGLVTEETATPTAATTEPGAPRSLDASGGNGRVTLSWTAPASDGGAAISRYEYRYKTTGNYPATWTTVNGGGSARSVTVSSLANDTLHTFQVRARNSVGPGLVTEETATPTAATTEPGAPRSLDASGGNGRVTLSWTTPSSDGGAAITRYEYRYKTTGNYPATWTNAGGGSARSATVTGLTNDTPHTFQVRAVNSAGDGTASEVMATPTADPEPVPALPLTGAVGLGLLLLGAASRVLRARGQQVFR